MLLKHIGKVFWVLSSIFTLCYTLYFASAIHTLLNLTVLMTVNTHKWKYYRIEVYCVNRLSFTSHLVLITSVWCATYVYFHLLIWLALFFFSLRCANFIALSTVWCIMDKQFRRVAAHQDSASPKSASHGAVRGDDTSSQRSVFLVVYNSYICRSLISLRCTEYPRVYLFLSP